jgi:predicted porin
MIFGVRTDVLIAHDRQSGDIFDNDTIERLFAFVQTGFGRLEIGEQDGAGYALALTGPEIDPQVSLEARTISLFRSPVTHRDFAQFFKQVTAAQSSSNYAKLNYLSPRLFGVQIGASFTPQTLRTPLPWTGNPSNRPSTQRDIWELAANYTGYVSGVAIGFSGAYAQGSERQKAPGGEGLYDWSLGAELAYSVEDTKLTIGGAYRSTNAWLLDVTEVARGFATNGGHFSATIERGPWRLGAETSSAHAEGPTDYTITGYQATLGYEFTPALTLSAGWQRYNYVRNNGLFYNGRPSIGMNAGYLGLAYSL